MPKLHVYVSVYNRSAHDIDTHTHTHIHVTLNN